MAGYRSDIDGLRALAVLPVVAFHGGLAGFGGGFTGVDIFFVISGYLLTGILMRELGEGRYTLSGFYVRRARRILPAVTVMVAACLVAGYYLMAPGQYAQTAQAAQGVATISTNMYFARIKADYWDQSLLADQPLLHTWSLAVEEQFYVGLPLLLWLLYQIGTAGHRGDEARARSMALGVLAAVAVISLAYAQWLLEMRPGDVFYLVLPRTWELLTGSLLAIWLGWRGTIASVWLRNSAGGLGIALIVASVALLNERMPFPGMAALLPCMGAALVIWSGSVGWGPAQKLLSLPLMVWIGKVSYSLYLWHWPVFAFVNSAGWHGHGLPFVSLPLQFALMLLLAWLSWRFVEQPFRQGRMLNWGAGRVLTVSIASLVVLWTTGFVAYRIAQDGWPVKQSLPGLVALLETDLRAAPGLRCEGSSDPVSIRRDGGGCLLGVGDAAPRFALVGDSHARMYTEAVETLMREHQSRALVIARSSCVPVQGVQPPTRPECRELTQASIDYLVRSDIPRVVLAGYWIDLATDDAKARILAEGLDSTVAKLSAAGKQVVLLKDVPELPNDLAPHRGAQRSLRAGGAAIYGPSLEDHEQTQSRFTAMLDEIARKNHSQVLDPATLLCSVEGCLIANRNRSLYRDRHHLTDAAAVAYRNILLPLLEAEGGQ